VNNYMRTVIICFIFSLLILSGCDDQLSYKGENTDLNCVVTNSILGYYSYDYNTIVVMEEDAYGRKMFINWGQTVAALDKPDADKPAYILSILISQKTEDGFVYYYPDNNFIIYKVAQPKRYNPSEEELYQYTRDICTEEDVEWLKEKNDWGNPIDVSKCVSVKVSKRSREYASQRPPAPTEAREKAYQQVATPQDIFYTGLFYYLTSDSFDRHIYFFRLLQDDKTYTKSYVVMFNKDGSFSPADGVMEITDLWRYQDMLRDFRERNGWDTPLERK